MSETRIQDPHRHTLPEDTQGLLTGTLLVALSVSLLHGAGLFTGQIAGLSLVLSYVTGWSFGAIFFTLNLPFYWLAFRRMGARFTVKTVLSVALLSGFTEVFPHLLSFAILHPGAAAVLAGVTAGAGLLALFRHGASLGGVGIVALYLQDKTGFKAGRTQILFDCGVFLFALFVLPLDKVLWSLLGAMVLNVIILINHRRDRYIAT
ncbi:YitT family protein [Thioclava electrotropha]|uniref:YitT family protein n=1 Tax=Thioclava electrotropha TaxID=1549850 RepID=A0ABX6YUA0_9RHOB|nr:YitT family protein [Thioclava electrotropha]QPZ91313.1 YitT family protein [Thioclava electrotropha]